MKNEVILYIDTANNAEIEIGLELDGKKDTMAFMDGLPIWRQLTVYSWMPNSLLRS